MWQDKVEVDWPLAKIGLKMSSGQLLFCALLFGRLVPTCDEAILTLPDLTCLVF